VETTTVNALLRRLYPEDYSSLRIDAHHVIEDRTFDKFRSDWKLLGWESSDDMAALPILYEFHIRTPKNLPGIRELARQKDVTSLTHELLQTINLNKIKNVDDLISAYRNYYFKTPYRSYAEPLLKAIQKRIDKQRTLSKGFRQLRKSK